MPKHPVAFFPLMNEQPSTPLAGRFEVGTDHLHALGVMDPYSSQSMALYQSGRMTSEERLYFALWGSSRLDSSFVEARARLCAEGEPVRSAYFLVKGEALGLRDGVAHRLGPGSVIGLAEGLDGRGFSMTVMAVSDCQLRVFPMPAITALVRVLPTGLRAILRSAVMRTLALDRMPELPA